MKRNLRFVLLLIKLRLSHLMVFRLSFFGGFLADGVYFLVQLLTFQVIYGQVDVIGDWSRGEMLIFIGTFSILNGLSMFLCFFGLIRIPGLIRSGGLDLYITKPVSPLLRLTLEHIDFGSAPLLILSGLIVAYGVSVTGIPVTAYRVLAYAVLVLLMAVLYCDMELILRTIPFFVRSTGTIDRLEGEMLTLNFRIPGVFYRGVFKVLFYFILPYGIMATVPTQLLVGTLSAAGLLSALGTVLLFTLFALWFWRLGLRRYESASS